MRTLGYPQMIVQADHIAPAPRRVRAALGGQVILDTVHAIYLWEVPYYPQYYIPVADVAKDVLIDEDREEKLSRGTVRRHGLRVGDLHRPGAALVYTADALPGLEGMVRFEWDAADAWYEEDEPLLSHPRSPYARVDALRSHRHVHVSRDGVELAESSSPVILFETGLPPRHYLERTAVNFGALEHSATETVCAYKGRTSDYWSVKTPSGLVPDLAWSYIYPLPAVAPIAGLVCFLGEHVDIRVDGELLDRPATPFT